LLESFPAADPLKKAYSELWIKEGCAFDHDGSIRIEHGLKIIGSDSLGRIPKNLKIHGPFRLMGCPNIHALPTGLEVAGGFWISGSDIVEIPEDLKLGGNLSAVKCPSLRTLPNIRYPGNVFLNHCPSLISLPEGFHVDETAYLDHSPIQTLPNRMNVGQLSLVGCDSLERLPDDLIVNGDLILSKHASDLIQKQADALRKKHQIKGRVLFSVAAED